MLNFSLLDSRRLGVIVIVLLWLFAAPQGIAQTERKAEWAKPVDQVANLYRVTPHFYRSAKLGPENLPVIETLGIKTVVSLRAFHKDFDLLAQTNIKAISVPINTWNIKDSKVVDALRAIRAAEQNGPVLLHCQHGADRTGLIVAMYRLIYQQWSKEAALEELTQGGYGYHALWKNIPHYLRTVDVEAIRQRVEKGGEPR